MTTPDHPSERLAEAFDRWKSLSDRLDKEGPKAVSVEDISEAWATVLQRHEEWSNSR